MSKETSSQDATVRDQAGEVEGRFQSIETKVLYQERTVDELNSVVTTQQNQIDELIAETKRLRQSIEGGQDGGVDAAEEPPPPHY